MARLATVAVTDSESLTSAIRDWIAFTKKHAPQSASWDCYTDTNGRLHRVSYMDSYASLDQWQQQYEGNLKKYHELGLPDLVAKWNKGAGASSVNLWRFKPELSYIKGAADSNSNGYRKVYLVYLKRDRVEDWIKAAKLMNEIDGELGHEYHRYVYECEIGDSQPLYAVVIPAENQLDYLKAFQRRVERRESSSLNAEVHALFQDATRKIEEIHLTHHPELSYHPE